MPNDDEPIFVLSEDQPDEKLSRAYKDSPSIGHYLELRKAHPDKEIEIAITGGIDWLLMNEKLVVAHGIEARLITRAMDADPEAISALSLMLLQMLTDRERLTRDGKTHIVSRGEGISDSLVNYLTAIMLDALSWNNTLEIPRDLIVLARHQLLGSSNPDFIKRLESRETQRAAVSIAAQYLERGEPVSLRQIAAILQKNVSTISRMFPDNSLEIKAESFLGGLRMVTKSQTPFADMLARQQAKTED